MKAFFTRFKKFMNSAPGEFEVEDITDGSFVNDLTSVVRNPIKRSIKKYNNREKEYGDKYQSSKSKQIKKRLMNTDFDWVKTDKNEKKN